MSGVLWTIGIILLGWYWFNAQGVKEIAVQATKAYCTKINVQMLDDCVAMRKLWFKRDTYGSMQLWRSFSFEFTSTGEERYNGQIVMLGNKILSIESEPHRM